MELLFHGGGSEGHVLRRCWSEEDPERIETDFSQGKAARLQWPRSHRNRCQAFSGSAVCNRLSSLAPRPTELPPRWRRGTAQVATRRRLGQRLSCGGDRFDRGQPTKAAEYSLADNAYAKLLGQLSERKFDRISPELRANILDFCSDPSAAIEMKKDEDDWKNVLSELDQLKSITPTPIAARHPG